MSWRIWVRALTRALRAERLATTRTRMASTAPSLLLAVPWARPDCAALAASTASRGSDFPLCLAGLAVLAVHFDDLDPGPGEMTGDPGAIGPGPFDSDLGDLAERWEPSLQLHVAVGIGAERFGAEQATDLVEHSGHVDLAVGVDATDDSARAFYDGHAIPSFP